MPPPAFRLLPFSSLIKSRANSPFFSPILKDFNGQHVRYFTDLEPKSSVHSTYMSRLFPRCNSSFLLSSGNALQSEVLRFREERFLVNAGIGTPRICMQDELTGVPNRTTRFENKVGYLGLVAGDSLINEQILKRFFIDLVAGESLIKERAANRFNDLVGSTDVVAGEPTLLLPRRFRTNRARMELNKIWRTNTKVKGFILKKVKGGYSVAIGGFIALLPFRFLRRKKRVSNDRFTIERINPTTRKRTNIVVLYSNSGGSTYTRT